MKIGVNTLAGALLPLFRAFLCKLVYAQDNGLPAVKTVVTLDTAAYRAEAEAHMQETGELLPGVETPPEHETHRLTFGKSE